MNDWLKIIKKEYPDLFIVGEVWMNDPKLLLIGKKEITIETGLNPSWNILPIPDSINIKQCLFGLQRYL
jgi:hypothetical protein